jgi:uncharacterized membrane protein YkoI
MTQLLHKSARRLLPALFLALLSLGFNSLALARPQGPGQEDARPILLAQAEMSLDAAAAMVREKFGGKVIDAKTDTNRGRRVHVIKLLSDKGRVTIVKVDAQTGRIL